MHKNFRFSNTILNDFLPNLTSICFSKKKFFVRNNNIIFTKRRQTTFMSNNNTIDIAGTNVPVTALQTDINIASVLEFKPFKDWVSAISKETRSVEKKELEVKKVEIQNVDYFGSGIGFIKFKVDARSIENGKNVPGIIFMRGGSVAILLILRSKDKNETLTEHVILTEQPRMAVPSFNFLEIPAGMLDGSGNFTGKASEEIKEETGIVIKDQDLIDMTELAYGNQYKGVYPSPGGCDEFMRLCLCIMDMDKDDVQQLEGKLSGLRDRGERIVVRLIKLSELWKIPDMKALSALSLYEALKKEGKV